MSKLERYEVFLRDVTTGHRWSMLFMANSFDHAEEQSKPYMNHYDEVIYIHKDWSTDE